MTYTGATPTPYVNPLETCPTGGGNCGTIIWATANPGSAKITGMFKEDYTNVMFLTLDKNVDPAATVFYFTPNSTPIQGFQNMNLVAPASMIDGFQGNPYNSSPANAQSLEFRLGQTAMNRQVQNAWLM